MDSPVDDGIVLVTGASSGIGREIARLAAETASELILVARREGRLRELKEELRRDNPDLSVHVAPCDLADPDDIQRLLDWISEELPGVDVLVNNAGLGDVGLFEDADWGKLNTMIQVNITGLTRLTHGLVGGMVERGSGGILNISSGFGLTFMPGMAAYIGTKHYVTGFNEALRSEMAGTGVRVVQVCPGPVDTEFEEQADNPTGHSVPSWIELSAERCAKVSLRSLRENKPLVVPGFLMSCLLFLARWTPRAVMRLFYWPVSRMLRREQKKALAEKEKENAPVPMEF